MNVSLRELHQEQVLMHRSQNASRSSLNANTSMASPHIHPISNAPGFPQPSQI